MLFHIGAVRDQLPRVLVREALLDAAAGVHVLHYYDNNIMMICFTMICIYIYIYIYIIIDLQQLLLCFILL